MNRREIKFSQYANDTTLILDGTKESLKASLKTLDDFYEVSGLKLNDKKIEALWIGANSGNDGISTPGKKNLYGLNTKLKLWASGSQLIQKQQQP